MREWLCSERELASCEQYQALLAVAQAIVAHRDQGELFHDLAEPLHRIAQFDFLACVLHDAASNSMRLHVVEADVPLPPPAQPLSVDDHPGGSVWRTQQALILSDRDQLARWPRFRERRRAARLEQRLFSSAHLGPPPARRAYFWLHRAAGLRLGRYRLLAAGRQSSGRGRRKRPGVRQDRAAQRETRSARRCIWKRRFAPSRTLRRSSAIAPPCGAFSRKSRPSPRPILPF